MSGEEEEYPGIFFKYDMEPISIRILGSTSAGIKG
jgi:hypothetical protein